MRKAIPAMLLTLALAGSAFAQKNPLRDVSIIDVSPTVVSNPDKVKDASVASTVEDQLRAALVVSKIEIGESPITAHLILDEFNDGSQVKRFLVGFGAGRSTVSGRLVFNDADKEIASVKVRVRGNLIFGHWQGAGSQTKQAVSAFQRKLTEEIEKLK